MVVGGTVKEWVLLASRSQAAQREREGQRSQTLGGIDCC